MTVKFWGVRGSFATPHPQMLRYGGNTSCVSVTFDRSVLIIDAGTGIRQLGHSLAGSNGELFLLMTHLHNDHIEGFPFFGSLYEAGHCIRLFNYRYGTIDWSPLSMMDGIHYPMRPSAIRADHCAITNDAMAYLRDHGMDVRQIAANHPGGAYGYRVARDGGVFVHIPDNELSPPSDVRTTSYDAFVQFCLGADVLSHDAMYTGDDMPSKWGWGHSQVDQVCQLAIDAGVGHLVLFHHDPDRTDDALDILQERARSILMPHGIECSAAFEGLTFRLGT